MKLVNGRYPYQWFKIVENLTDTSMMEMISWARFIVFEDEPTHLFLARNDKINEVKKKREEQKKIQLEDDSEDELDLQDVFKGHNIKAYNAQTEEATWQLIKQVAIEASQKYPQTLEEDISLIQEDNNN